MQLVNSQQTSSKLLAISLVFFIGVLYNYEYVMRIKQEERYNV